MKKKKEKELITDGQWTYVNLCSISIAVDAVLGQYNTHWMPKELQKHYTKMQKDASKLEMIAEKLFKKGRLK